MIEFAVAAEIIRMAFNSFLTEYYVWLFGWFLVLTVAHLGGYVARGWARR